MPASVAVSAKPRLGKTVAPPEGAAGLVEEAPIVSPLLFPFSPRRVEIHSSTMIKQIVPVLRYLSCMWMVDDAKEGICPRPGCAGGNLERMVYK